MSYDDLSKDEIIEALNQKLERVGRDADVAMTAYKREKRRWSELKTWAEIKKDRSPMHLLEVAYKSVITKMENIERKL